MEGGGREGGRDIEWKREEERKETTQAARQANNFRIFWVPETKVFIGIDSWKPIL